MQRPMAKCYLERGGLHQIPSLRDQVALQKRRWKECKEPEVINKSSNQLSKLRINRDVSSKHKASIAQHYILCIYITTVTLQFYSTFIVLRSVRMNASPIIVPNHGTLIFC